MSTKSTAKFVVRQRPSGQWEWILVNRGNALARSARIWDRKSDARRSAESVSRQAPSADITHTDG